jgi:hypothetical protein
MPDKFNNFNPGIYCAQSNYVFGAYRNSIDRQSYYSAYNFEGQNFGLVVGAVSGYKKKIVPLILPTYKINLGDGYAIKTGLVVKYAKTEPWGLHVALEKRF